MGQDSSWPTCKYAVDDQWHTYSLVWAATSVSMLMDGEPTGCGFTKAQGYVIPSTPMFLIIQTQTGGIGGTPNSANLPANFQISNVTVTQP